MHLCVVIMETVVLPFNRFGLCFGTVLLFTPLFLGAQSYRDMQLSEARAVVDTHPVQELIKAHQNQDPHVLFIDIRDSEETASDIIFESYLLDQSRLMLWADPE